MKILPLITAGAVGSVMAAASIVPASAAAEPVFQVHSAGSLESATFPESEESGNFEDVAVEEGTSDETEVIESDTPAPEVEVQPQATEAEVPAEPGAAVSETAAAQAAETPIIEPVEILSALPTEESSAETAEAPPEGSVAHAGTPLVQPPAMRSSLPSVQESPAEIVLPSVEEALSEVGSPPTNGSELGSEAPFVEAEAAQAADEADQDTPREPRPIETLDPAENNDEGRPSEAATENSPSDEATADSESTNEAASEQAKDREIEAAESPDEKPLPQTGSPAAAGAIGGALLLIIGMTLASWRRRNNG